jgi:hypothetical protein
VSGDDHVPDEQRSIAVVDAVAELTDRVTAPLYGTVDGVDVVVGGGRDREVSAAGSCFWPASPTC